jgi:K+-sensing histidine kinase KdpD
MVVPLRARRQTLGALLLARDARGAPYVDADLQLASELARRAASALDNARLYERAQRAVRARDDVLGVVLHDLRTPLSVISMCASAVLADEANDADRTREAMHSVQRSVEWRSVPRYGRRSAGAEHRGRGRFFHDQLAVPRAIGVGHLVGPTSI